MTPRSAAEREPGTALERFEYALSVIEPVVPQLTEAVRSAFHEVMEEVRAEARSEGHKEGYLSRTEDERLSAEAWQAGYEACWNRLKDAGRLLPSNGAAVPLDVERLAEAMAVNGISDGDGLPLFDIAEKIAVEYASTGEGRTPCPVCPHWLELHNPDGSCGCGMNCRARLSADEEGDGLTDREAAEYGVLDHQPVEP